MKVVTIDEYLIINTYSGYKKWLVKPPKRKGAYDVVIRVRGKVKIPDTPVVVEIGEISIPEYEANAQAMMG